MAEPHEEFELLVDIDEEDAGDDGNDEEQLTAALNDLQKRCCASGIQFDPPSEELGSAAVVHMPAGQDKRRVYVSDLEDAQQLLNNEFEKYTFLENYDAICSYADGFIAAALTGINQGALHALRRRILGLKFGEIVNPNIVVELEPPPQRPDLKVSLRASTPAILAGISRSVPCLELRGLSISTHDAAKSLLELVADGVFFELDVRFNIAVGIRKVRRVLSRPFPKSDELSRKSLHVPTYKYDQQPASLYWYGRSAINMPLLQFLAFYQVLEYYFPIASQREAISQTRSILKHPSFSVNDDRDVSRLLGAMQSTRSGAYGDERSQLRATIQSCVTAQDLRSFVTSDAKFVSFYSESKEWKAISNVKIPINNSDADLRNEVSDRIYDIRCKIVHAKIDGGPAKSDLLLPFSKEAELLGFDIEVIRYIARQALTASSTPISW